MGMGQCKAAMELYAVLCATEGVGPGARVVAGVMSADRVIDALMLDAANPAHVAGVDRAIAKLSGGGEVSFRAFLACIAALAYEADADNTKLGVGSRRRFSNEGEIRALFRMWLLRLR